MSSWATDNVCMTTTMTRDIEEGEKRMKAEERTLFLSVVQVRMRATLYNLPQSMLAPPVRPFGRAKVRVTPEFTGSVT